jgi:hypothetical protein
VKKSTLYLYSKWTFLAAKSKRAILRACAILCASLGAKFGIPDEFSPNCFPITPPRNWNIGNGHKDLVESGFKIGENSPIAKKNRRQDFYKK